MMTSSNEKISALLAICTRNPPVTGEFPAQRPVTRSFDIFICALMNGWVNTGEAGDCRRHRAHYYVIVMLVFQCLEQTAQNPIPFNLSLMQLTLYFFSFSVLHTLTISLEASSAIYIINLQEIQITHFLYFGICISCFI